MKSEERYLHDDTVGMEVEDSPWNTIIAAAAITAGGVLAYKSGLLQKGMSKLIATAGTASGKSGAMMKAFRNWTKDGDLTKKYTNSLIRNSKLLDDDALLSKKGIQGLSAFAKKMWNSDTRQQIIRETREDLGSLTEEMAKQAKNADNYKTGRAKNRITDTELYRLHNRVKENSEAFGAYVSKEAGEAASKQGYKDLQQKMVQDAKDAAKQKKRTGYRALTIEDVVKIDANEGFVQPLIESDVFSDDMIKHIQELSQQTFVDSDGKVKKLIESNNFGKLKIDSSIFINDKGQISDVRRMKNTFKDMVGYLATDFQVPVIGINPLRMFGLDNLHRSIDDFGVFLPGTTQSALTASKDIIKKPFLLSGGNVFDIAADGTTTKIKSNVSAVRLFRDNRYNNREMEALIKMQGTMKNNYTEFTKTDGRIRNLWGAFGRKFDIGRSDIRNRSHRDLGLGDKLNPNNFIEGLFNGLFHGFKGAKEGSELSKGILRTYQSYTPNFGTNSPHLAPEVGADILGAMNDPKKVAKGLLDFDESPIMIAVNDSIKITDAVLQRNGATLGGYFGQYFAGRKNLDKVTKKTLQSFHVVERVNSTLNIAGLGLSTKSLGSSQDVLKNLITKRALPVFLGYNAYEYINYLTEDEETGDNVTKKTARGIVNVKLTVAKARDAIGITGFAKRLGELTPGSDQITEIPGVNMLDFGKSEEELREYYENGYDPIRKGRYWDIGVQPFTGTKINYYRANWYRRVQADVKFSDSQYGSRREYFDNAPFPTPTALFAPVRHFVTDRYHWERKHYEDRPYPITAPAFSSVPVVGPVLSATVGQLAKPQIRMHRDDLRQAEATIAPGGYGGVGSSEAGVNLQIAGGIASPGMAQNGYARPAIYTTAGGKTSIVGISNTTSDAEVRQVLKNRGIGSVIGTTQRLNLNTGIAEETEENISNTANLLAASGSTYNNMTDFLGIYGYAARSLTGKANEDRVYMENPAYATSMGRMFWDQELGGLGGEISEIFRRFIPKRGPNEQYYNPIRNTMAEWMPGKNYFIDFKHGDPYVKIKNGEERLAGEGYERLNNIDIYDMRIGSSSISKTKEEIIAHYLNQDPILSDTLGEEVTKEGDAIHKQIEREWLDSGYAIETEGRIDDRENNIIGFYDARVHDPDSMDGQAILDIKTVNDRIFNEAKKNGIRDDHKRQVNYYLWSTGLQRGGVHYVNRDTGETYEERFDFDRDLFNDTLKNVYDARNEIMAGIEKGTIARGDLYSHVDRLRILADVAPYSEEYKQMAAIVSRSRLTEEEKEEVRQIRARASAQKQPMRTYDYKFKTADLVKERVEVQRMYDYNTIYVDGYDAPVRLAGIDVKVGDTERERKEIQAFMEDVFDPGNNITLGVDKASNLQTKSGSIRAVVYRNGRNINRELIERGYATVNEEDDSAAAIVGRYNLAERTFGSIWETIAHADTPFHTKFMNVRSPLESYERERIYGKQFTEWSDPIDDFIKPLVIDRNVNRGFFSGIIWGGVVGAMFGATKSGKIVGATIGATAVTIGKAYKAAHEVSTGERWKPERIEKENEINEYMDMLKYIKSKKLYNEYADRALSEDGIDVRRLIGSKKSEGRNRKSERYDLQETKQLVKSSGVFMGTLKDLLYNHRLPQVNPFGKEKEELRKINAKIAERQGHRELLTGFDRDAKGVNWKVVDRIQALQLIQTTLARGGEIDRDIAQNIIKTAPAYVDTKSLENREMILAGVQREIDELSQKSGLTDNVVKAIQYYNESEQTMYGYDKGDPITNLLAAMPKRDRDYFNLFVNAPEEERGRILELAPKYMRRALEASWRIEPEAKPSLMAYFQNRALPDAEWKGWNENVSLNAIRVKMFKKADLDFSDVNVWKDDVKEANAAGHIPIPRLNARSSANRVRNDLYDLLGEAGVRDLRIEMSYSSTDSNIDLNLNYDTKKKIQQQLQEYEDDLVG